MLKDDFYFIDNKIAKENIGEHDGDNRFLAEGIKDLMPKFYETHPGCTPIGICYEDEHPRFKGFFRWFLKMKMEIAFTTILI